jgi:hypothetical protein
MNIPLNAFLLPQHADPFHKEVAVYIQNNKLVIASLQHDDHSMLLDVATLPDLVDALIELQNRPCAEETV